MLTADQAQQGQTQNGLKGMSDPSGHPGIRYLLQALQRFLRLHNPHTSHLSSLPYLCKPPSPTLQIVLVAGLSILKGRNSEEGQSREACSCSVAAPPRYWLPPVATPQCVLRKAASGAPMPLGCDSFIVRPARNAAGSRSPNGPQAGLSRTQTGDGLGQLLSGRSLTGHLALHTAHLPYLGPVQILIEGGGGPQGTLFPTVAVPPALPSRGQLFPPGWFGKQQGNISPQGRLVILHHPEIVTPCSTTCRLRFFWAYRASPVTTRPARSTWPNSSGATLNSASFSPTPLLSQGQAQLLPI